MNKYQNMTPQEILSEAKTLAQEATVLAEKTEIKALSIESINKSENAVLNQVFELIALAHSVQDDLKIRVTFSTGIKAVYLTAEFNDSEEQLDCGFVSLDEPKVLEELLKSEDKLLSLVAEAKDKKEEIVCA